MNTLRWTSLALLVLLMNPGAWADSADRGIHVNGRGTLEVAPDMGYLQLHARREGTSADTLKRELDTVVRSVLELTNGLSIAARDVTATAVSISPRYQRRNNESVVEGLIATRTVAVTLRDLDLFSELMNGSLEVGINNLDPIRLDTSDRDSLENKALELAMADAAEEAARVSAGFSVGLGRVTNVIVGGHSPRPQAAAREMRMAADSGDFSPGLIRIERSVQATFAIQQEK